MAPQVTGLLKDGQAPTAIRAQYYHYTFTDPSESSWWKRQPVSGDTPKIFLPPSAPDTSVIVQRQTPPHRSWMLLLSICGTAMAVRSVQITASTAKLPSRCCWFGIMSVQLIYCVATFSTILLQDYPALRVSLGMPAAYIDAFGLHLSPDSWGELSTGYASVFGFSAAQALGLISVGLKLRAADSNLSATSSQDNVAMHGQEELDTKLEDLITTVGSVNADTRGLQVRGHRRHMMDSHLLLSALLAGVMMMVAKNAGNYSETLFRLGR